MRHRLTCFVLLVVLGCTSQPPLSDALAPVFKASTALQATPGFPDLPKQQLADNLAPLKVAMSNLELRAAARPDLQPYYGAYHKALVLFTAANDLDSTLQEYRLTLRRTHGKMNDGDKLMHDHFMSKVQAMLKEADVTDDVNNMSPYDVLVKAHAALQYSDSKVHTLAHHN
jgi:hypothetical protein